MDDFPTGRQPARGACPTIRRNQHKLYAREYCGKRRTHRPGVYCSNAGTTIGAGVTITLDGDADDVWIFRIGTGGLGALTGTGPNLEVVMGGSADACNVYWHTAEGATMTDATSVGNVLSGAAATMTGTTWEAW